MWKAADLADWWDEQHAESRHILDDYLEAHPDTLGVVLVGSTNTAMDLASGTVDALRLGEGARIAWDNRDLGAAAQDGLRLLQYLPLASGIAKEAAPLNEAVAESDFSAGQASRLNLYTRQVHEEGLATRLLDETGAEQQIAGGCVPMSISTALQTDGRSWASLGQVISRLDPAEQALLTREGLEIPAIENLLGDLDVSYETLLDARSAQPWRVADAEMLAGRGAPGPDSATLVAIQYADEVPQTRMLEQISAQGARLVDELREATAGGPG